MKTQFFERPHTRFGWWSLELAAASVVLILAWSLLPGGAGLGFLCGIASGFFALQAITRQHERSWLTWLSLLPLAFVLFFLVGEFLFPH